MKYVLNITIIIFFPFLIGCSDIGDVSDNSPITEKDKNKSDENTTEKDKNKSNENITEKDKNKSDENITEKDKNKSDENTTTTFRSTEPYANPLQPTAERDPYAPDYVEPKKEYLNGKELKTLVGDIEQDFILTKNFYWKISGEVRVKTGYKLVIEAGTTIFGEDKTSTLYFEDGSEIEAIGKRDEPIIFSSKYDVIERNPKAGDWGGITLNSNQNSILKYVQIRYAGHNRASLKLENVGFGTVLEFVEIYISNSDGIQLIGGDVNLRNTLILGANGDSLSLKNSWNGKVQNIYIHQFSELFGDKSSGLEVEGDIKDVILSNVAIVSDGLDVGAGIYLRTGSSVQIVNSIVTGKRSTVCLKAETLSTGHIFISDVLGNCLGGHLLKIKLDEEIKNTLTTENLSLKELSKKVQPINPYSLDSWFDDYPELYIGSFNFNSDKKWSDNWSIGMEKIFNEK